MWEEFALIPNIVHVHATTKLTLGLNVGETVGLKVGSFVVTPQLMMERVTN